MTREELRKKRQEIAQKNGYAGYDTRKYSPVKQNTTPKETTPVVNNTPAEPTINKINNTINTANTTNNAVQQTQQKTSTWNNVQTRIANQGVSKRSLSEERVAQANNNKLVNKIAAQNQNNTQPIQGITKKEAKKQVKEGKKLLAELEYNKNKEDREKQYQKDLQNADSIGDKAIVGVSHVLETAFQKPKALYDGKQIQDIITIPASTAVGAAAHGIEGVKSIGDALAYTSAYGVASVANITGHKEFSDKLVRAIKEAQQETKETTDRINSLWDKNSLLGESGNQALNSAGQSSVFGALGEASEAYKAAGQLKKAKALKRIADGLTFTMGASGGFEEAYNKENVNGWEAILKATGGGAASYISENLFDWMGYGGNKLTKGLKEKIGKQFNSGLASGFARLGFSAFGEGAEEIAEEVLTKKFVNSLVNKIIGENKYDTDVDIAETVSNSVVAMLSVLGTGAAPTAVNAKYTSQQTKNIEQIQNSNLDENQKEALTKIAEQYNLSDEDVKTAIQNTLDGKYDNIEGNQPSTMQNNEVLQEGQQTTQEQSEMTQNEISDEVRQKVTNMMRSMDKYNETRQEGQEIFDINNEETQKEVKAIQKIVEDRNINITFDESKFDNTTDNAYYEYDKDGNVANIYLNPNSASKKYVQNLAIHEIVHSFSGKQKTNLMKDVINYAKTLDGYNEAYQDIKEAYQNKYGEDVSEDVINEEVVANILGEKLGDKQFVNDLINGKYANQNRNWAQKLYDFVKNQINRFRGYKDQEQYWTHVKELFDDAYRNSEINKQDNKSYSIGGEVAKENYNRSNGNNTNLAKMYNQAVKMSQQKISNETIRKQTHWFKDKNGQWKFEFSDRDMKLKDFLQPNSQYKLGDILEHDILFELYPELRDYTIKTRKMDSKGVHYGNRKTIIINNALLNANKNIEKTLIHEIQHAIQKIEKFEGGTSTKKSRLNYYKSLGEIESTDVSKRFEEEKYNNNRNVNETAPESSKKNPKHNMLDSYLQNRGLFDKIRDNVYNSVKDFFKKESESYDESFEEDLGNHNGKNNDMVDGGRRYINESKNSKQSSFSMQQKQKQLEIIKESNPMLDDYHTGIRNIEDIKTFEEAIKDDESFVYGDYTLEDAKNDLEKGTVTVYSSKPIEQGGFVSTSKNMAKDYAGSGKIYSQEVNINDVAWINGDEGQYAKIDSETNNKDSEGRTLTKEQQKYFKDSKIKDENGNLKVMYHGTNADFNEFDTNKIDIANLGKGFYFTDIKEIADSYAERRTQERGGKQRTIEAYINSVKPFDMGNVTREQAVSYLNYDFYNNGLFNRTQEESNKMAEDFIKELEEENWGEKRVKHAEERGFIKTSNGFDYSMTITTSSNTFQEWLKKEGYDALIVPGQDKKTGIKGNAVIVFNSNQVKNVDNTNPTSSNDIRYSVETSKTDNNGNKLSKGQQDYFKESKARNDNGELEVVYHGSNRAGFTEFNRNFNYYTNNKEVAQSYTGGTEIVDTKKLESVSDAKSWLKGINEDLYINENKVYDDGEEILSYSSPEEMLKNLKRDIQKEVGGTEAGGVYEGYVNITKPVTIDANNEVWSMIDINNINIEGIDNVEQFLKDAGSSVWKEKGKMRTSTADIVAAIYDAVEEGRIDADGVIIKNIYDEGGYGNITPTESGTDYITFNPNQFKAQDNTNPTNNPDIRYSNDATGAWNTFIEKYFKNENEGTSIQDLKKKLPVRKYTINDYEEVLNNAKNISKEDKQAFLRDIENIEMNKESLKDFIKIVEDTDKAWQEYNAEQEKTRFNAKNYKDESRADLIRQKKKEFNKNMDYDDSVVAELDEIIPRNRNGKRTVAQWKNMAKELGSRIANMTPEQIEDIAVKSYYDLEPTKAITRYDNQDKTTVGFEQLYANDWVNSVYEGVRENRQFSIDTESGNPKLPTNKNNSNNNETKEDILKDIREAHERELGDTISLEDIQNLPDLDNSGKLEGELPKTIDRIVEKRTKQKITLSDLAKEFKKQFVNKGYAVDKLADATKNQKLKYKYDRQLMSFNEAQVSLGDAQVDTNGRVIGKSLIDVFKQADKTGLGKVFADYLENKNNVARDKLGENLYGGEVTALQSKKKAEEYEKKYPQFKEWAADVSNYNDNLAKTYLVGTFVDESLWNKLQELNPDYVPAFRDITETKGLSDAVDNVGFQVLKRAEGGSSNILTPKEAMAEQTLQYVKAFRKNETIKELYKTIKNDLKESDILYKDVETVPDIAYDMMKEAVGRDEDGNYTATFFENGKATSFKVSKDIFDSFVQSKAVQDIENNAITQIIGGATKKVAQFQRNAVTTYSLPFLLKNMVRDYNDALINTKYSDLRFMKNYAKAYAEIIGKGKSYQLYKNLGGGANTYYEYNKGLLPTSTKNPLKKFLNAVTSVNEVVEQAPRLAEFMSTLEKGGTTEEALYNSAEITTNFKRGGDTAKMINKYGANFFNASIQGADKFIRTVTGQKGLKGYANLIIKATVAGIAPSMINHLLLAGSDDDEERKAYEDLQDYLKDNYYLIYKGNGDFWRIPKGRISAVLGDTAVKLYRTTQGEDKAFDDYFSNVILENIAPNNPLTNNIIAPVLQAKGNKAWYGDSIYNESKYTNKLPVEVTDEKVDLLSNKIAEGVNALFDDETLMKSKNENGILDLFANPKKLNYILDQYSGGFGDLIMPLGTPQAESNVFADQFTTSSVLKNKYVNQFYEMCDNNIGKSEYATDFDKLTYKYLNSQSKEIGELYKEKHNIQLDENLSNAEKKKQVYEVQKQINDLCETTVKTIQDTKIDGNTAEFDGTTYYKDEKDEWKKVEADDKISGISNETYADFKNKIAAENKKKKDSEGKNLTDKEKNNILLNSTYSDIEKDAIYMQTTGKDDGVYEALKIIAEPDIDTYLTYTTQTFESLEDPNSNIVGKKVTKGEGTKKNQVINYIRNSNLSDVEQEYIIATQYKVDNTRPLKNYIESLNLDPEELRKVMSKISSSNVVELKDGNYQWK